MDIPIARSGRDSMIAVACLWVLFATSVCFRLWGRLRGPGLALDDIFAIVALVRTFIPSYDHDINVLTHVAVGFNDKHYRPGRCR
jgi:hypothetical protein